MGKAKERKKYKRKKKRNVVSSLFFFLNFFFRTCCPVEYGGLSLISIDLLHSCIRPRHTVQGFQPFSRVTHSGLGRCLGGDGSKLHEYGAVAFVSHDRYLTRILSLAKEIEVVTVGHGDKVNSVVIPLQSPQGGWEKKGRIRCIRTSPIQ